MRCMIVQQMKCPSIFWILFFFLHFNECEMQMSYANAMIECPYGACHDANVPLVHAMMQMPFVRMQWMLMPAWVCNECKCLLESMPWHRMLWCKHNLFKNSFYFQNEASITPETKIFSKLDSLFMKSHLPFDLRLPKKLVITVKKSPNGAFTWNLMIWLKRFIFTM